MVAPELEHPRILLRGLPKNRDEKEVLVPDLRTSSPSMISCTFSKPRSLSAAATSANAADRSDFAQLTHAQTGPRDDPYRKVGPSDALLLIVECELEALALFLAECRSEAVRGRHDPRGSRLRRGDARRQPDPCQDSNASQRLIPLSTMQQ
jgi:hypothetical protein